MVKSTKKPGRPKKTTAKKTTATKKTTPTISKGDSKKAKGVSLFGLGKRQQDAMVKHSQHHSKKHMAMMNALMNKGKSFKFAHRQALKIAGK